MFKFLLFLYILGFILSIGAFFVFILYAVSEFQKKYPDVKLPKQRISCKSVAKLLLMALFPIIQYLFLAVIIFKWDELVKETTEKVKEEYELTKPDFDKETT